MSHKPTDEQQLVIDAFRSADRPTLVVQAGAGCGKSSTLKMAAQTQPHRRGLYVAYNKALAVEASRDFPASVDCRTAHSLAFGPVGRYYTNRLNGPRVPAKQAAEILGFNSPVQVADNLAPLAPTKLARLTLEGVNRFLNSADPEPVTRHVVPVDGYTLSDNLELSKYLAPFMRKAWDDLQGRTGRLKFTHDCYLKLYQLSRPRIRVDYVLLDEAQDLSPVMASLFHFQDHAQRIMVGDSAQAIYGFRGAIDAMAKFQADQRLTLSQSFRFGPAIAGEANKWLELLGAPLRLRGFEPVRSMVCPEPAPDAILCRSNAGAISQLLRAATAGRKAALVGGGDEIRRLAEAAEELMDGRGTAHPELVAFRSWDDVREHASQDDASGNLKVLVKLIDDHGPDRIITLVEGLVDEASADVVISTAHKSKGREWDAVRIAGDFREPRVDPASGAALLDKDELMLAYVAVTRARVVLDRQGLSWVDDYVRPMPAPVQPESWIAQAVREHPEAVLPDAADELDDLPECRRCGCTEDQACPGGCQWAADEAQIAAGLDPMMGDLCTACLADIIERDAVRAAHGLPTAGKASWTPPAVPPPAPRKPCSCEHLELIHKPTARGRGRCSANSCGCQQYQDAAALEEVSA